MENKKYFSEFIEELAMDGQLSQDWTEAETELIAFINHIKTHHFYVRKCGYYGHIPVPACKIVRELCGHIAAMGAPRGYDTIHEEITEVAAEVLSRNYEPEGYNERENFHFMKGFTFNN